MELTLDQLKILIDDKKRLKAKSTDHLEISVLTDEIAELEKKLQFQERVERFRLEQEQSNLPDKNSKSLSM